MEKNKYKNSAIFLSCVLATLGIVFFFAAVCKEKSSEATTNSNHQIQVYINDNDSIINQLQSNVEHLTELLKDMQNDSLIITVEKVRKLSTSKP